MQRLCLLVSPDAPELLRQTARGLCIQRIETFDVQDRTSLKAFLLGPEFVRENCREIRRQSLPRGSVLLWNPDENAARSRALALERELERKELIESSRA